MSSTADDRPLLVTGGAGFIGCNLADRLAGEGHEVIVYDSLARPGVERNLEWLRDRHPGRIAAIVADIRDAAELGRAVREAGAVFHMAAQVAVTTSFEDPREDFEINLGGTLGLLEAVRRRNPHIPLLFASTNKVYGDLADLGFALSAGRYRPLGPVADRGVDESRPLDFHTPYGCSKGGADQYVLDHARSYGIPAAVFRMSCIYGRRQMGTEDQGWVAHFLIRALAGDSVTIYGDGRQVRDILNVADAVEAYVRAWRGIERVAGRAFNLGGGPANAVSLLGLIHHIAMLSGHDVRLAFEDWRAGDQRWFVADTGAAREALDLPVRLGWRKGVADLATWLRGEPAPSRSPQPMLAAAMS
jgi:CDP-paratose 2-epimerase